MISQRLGAGLFMFNILNLSLQTSLWQTDMPRMGGVCGRRVRFQTSTVLLCFSPSPTTHLANSHRACSWGHWRKQQKLSLTARRRRLGGMVWVSVPKRSQMGSGDARLLRWAPGYQDLSLLPRWLCSCYWHLLCLVIWAWLCMVPLPGSWRPSPGCSPGHGTLL